MTDHVYRVIQLVGSSEASIEDAINAAISKASNTLRHLRWFEVTQMRGEIEEGEPETKAAPSVGGHGGRARAASLTPEQRSETH